MNIGTKIINLRKNKNLSQEGLAEKLGVTRQTISKWELEETTPDIKQAKELSKIFNISLDELTNNDINDILIEKVSNTEKLAEITIKILKAIGIFLAVIFVLGIIGIIALIFNPSRIKNRKIEGQYSFTCNLNNEEYQYELQYNKNYQIINGGGDSYISNHIDVEKYDDANNARAYIEDWFLEHNGSCITKEK